MIAAAPLPICALQVCCHNNETCPARYYPARNAQAPRWIRAARARVGPGISRPRRKMRCVPSLLQRRVRVRRSPRRTEAPREGGASRLTLSDPALHRDTLSIAAELPTQHLLIAAPETPSARCGFTQHLRAAQKTPTQRSSHAAVLRRRRQAPRARFLRTKRGLQVKEGPSDRLGQLQRHRREASRRVT